MTPQTQRGDIQAIDRAAGVLRLVCDRRTVGVGDVSTALSLERTTAHRYLSSLLKVGLLSRLDDTDRTSLYQLGPLASTLAAAVVASANVFQSVTAELPRLADELHATAVISLIGMFPIIVTDVAYPRGMRLSARVPPGYELPLDAAQSIVALAHVPESDSEAILERLDSGRRERLREQIHDARGRRVIESTTWAGLLVSAAPLFQDGRIVATIAVISESEVGGRATDVRARLGALSARLSTGEQPQFSP